MNNKFNISGQEHFNSFCKSLKKRLELSLPGTNAHLKMASRMRMKELLPAYDNSKAIQSGVLILLYLEQNIIKTVLILRQSYNGVHSGQISFPGGRKEEMDNSLIETALRESKEEVNIDTEKVEILGTLSEIYIPPSNYNVLPVVGFTNEKPAFIRDKGEVAEIITVDLELFFDIKNRDRKIIDVRGTKIEAPYFNIYGHVIWGATAMILSELVDIIESIKSS